jgi:hypothetical protein
MFVDIRCPIRFECILSCSTTSGLLSSKFARGYILAEFCHSLTDFRANLSSLIKILKHRCFVSYTVSFLQGISINLERNAFKGKSRIVSCDICQVCAILVYLIQNHADLHKL